MRMHCCVKAYVSGKNSGGREHHNGNTVIIVLYELCLYFAMTSFLLREHVQKNPAFVKWFADFALM